MRYRRFRGGWKGLLLALALATPAAAEGERAGDFDYFVAALSWSAAWCKTEGDARGEPQCRPGQGITFVLHGLWPQFEDGWPSYCRTPHRDPTRAETAAAADLFGGAGAAFYQWKKHGRCAGLAPADYYALARKARAAIRVPPVLAEAKRRFTLPASLIEGAFLEVNPALAADGVTVTCKGELIAEVRVCLTRDLQPRRCGADAIRDCRLPDAVLLPAR
jgi:ribonuclease T2